MIHAIKISIPHHHHLIHINHLIIVVHYHQFQLKMYPIVSIKFPLKIIIIYMVLEYVIVPQNLVTWINPMIVVHHQSMQFDLLYLIVYNKIKSRFVHVQIPVALKDKVLHFTRIILNVIYLIILLL
jgi:hypothetical protein